MVCNNNNNTSACPRKLALIGSVGLHIDRESADVRNPAIPGAAMLHAQGSSCQVPRQPEPETDGRLVVCVCVCVNLLFDVGRWLHNCWWLRSSSHVRTSKGTQRRITARPTSARRTDSRSPLRQNNQFCTTKIAFLRERTPSQRARLHVISTRMSVWASPSGIVPTYTDCTIEAWP